MAASVALSIKWNTQEYNLVLPSEMSIAILKMKLQELTKVPTERQKLLGLTSAGKPAKDETLLKDLTLKPNMKIMMMGTPDENMLKEPAQSDVDVVNDLDITEGEAVLDPAQNDENKRKIQQRIDKYEIKMLRDPRPGKKLLVLDIDYTLFDNGSTVERSLELMRPYLHEFLTAAYEFYDIVIWSATSMKWIELKMSELNVTTNPNYKLTAFVDGGAMITVTSPKYGVFNCKPLQVIWGKLGQFYTPQNTIMFDDLGRNFIMNPANGLKIKAYKNSKIDGDKDEELKHLTTYLLAIKDLPDLTQLNHNKWKKYLDKMQD